MQYDNNLKKLKNEKGDVISSTNSL